MIPEDAGVDVEVQGSEESVRSVIEENLNPQGIVCVVKESDDFADKTGRGFKKTAVQRDGPVPVHPADYPPSEVILHVFGGFPDEMDVLEVAGQWSLLG